VGCDINWQWAFGPADVIYTPTKLPTSLLLLHLLSLLPAAMGVFTFIAKKGGDSWSAKVGPALQHLCCSPTLC
jgi:hypothetical protein